MPLSFDRLESRQLCTGLINDPHILPDVSYLDAGALDGAYTRPLYTPPTLTVVYPDHPPCSDILPTRVEIFAAP